MVMGEIAFCQLTSISECDPTIQELLIDIQSDDEASVIFHTLGWSNFWIKCRKSFLELWGKVKLILLEFPPVYFSEHGFCHVLHTHKKYRNRHARNKIGETPFN